MSTDDFDNLTPDEDGLLAGLHRSVAGATLATSAADVVALGRRARNRQRAVAAGIGTSAAAIVAAIGILAPSSGAGTGAGAGAPNAVAQGAVGNTTTGATGSSSGQVLNIQDAGFSLEARADGTVTLTLEEVFDSAKLKAALGQAGVPSAVLVTQVPEGWDLKRGIRCTPDPGVRFDTDAEGAFTKDPHAGSRPTIEIHKSKIPAGDYVTLMKFTADGHEAGGEFGLTVGQQKTCVPEYSPMTKTRG